MSDTPPNNPNSDALDQKAEDPILTKREWSWDFDCLVHEIEGMGPESRFRLKGRCTRCWGGLIGKGHGDGMAPSSIRCRVCEIQLEGDEARDEFQRMQAQAHTNTSAIAYGLPIKYREGATFVHKLFPYIERLSKTELRERTKEVIGTKCGKDPLTRDSFPIGSVGFLILQAQTLMFGVEELPWELSVVPPSEFDLGDDPTGRERELLRRLGCTMTIALNAAFACELVMKAICLTRLNIARRTHDLWLLFNDLPEDSRNRLEEDFGGVGAALRKARHTFGKWRYFEANIDAPRTRVMLETNRAFDLAKAARVLLDEARLMGIQYSIDIKATRNKTTEAGGRQFMHVKTNMDITGIEAPPR